MGTFSTTDRVLAVAARETKMPEQGHIWTKEQLGNLGQWILNQEKLHKNLKDLVKHHKLYPPKRTGEGLVIQDILYVDIVGIIDDFMQCFPDFDPDKYEATDEHGERIRERCKDCTYRRDEWICDVNGESVYDIPDELCLANETRAMTDADVSDGPPEDYDADPAPADEVLGADE